MNIKWRKVPEELLLVMKQAPVEIVVGIAFFVMQIVYHLMPEGYKHDDILSFFPLIVSLCYLLNKLFSQGLSRLFYYLSVFLPIPYLFIDISQFVKSDGYWYALLIALIGLISVGWNRDNLRYAERAISHLTNLLFGAAIAYSLYLAVIAIYASLVYIFNIETMKDWDFYFYAHAFTCFVSLPVAFLYFERSANEGTFRASRFMNILLNFILSPALIIYTVILYVYFTKIAVFWELPKGQITYMVFAFILSSVIGKACQPLLERNYYQWFYRNFSWISLPPLLMFWVGFYCRISDYGFTEARVYLLLLGILVTLCMLMFLNNKTGRYLYIAIISMFTLSLFTFIPGITARDIGIDSQEKRLDAVITKLGLADSTGKLCKIHQDWDTAQKEDYKKLYDIYIYVSRNRDSTYMVDRYGFEDAYEMKEAVIPSKLSGYVAWGDTIKGNSYFIDFSTDDEVDIEGYSHLIEIDSYYKSTTEYQYDYRDSILTVKAPAGKMIRLNMNHYVKDKLKELSVDSELMPKGIPDSCKSEFKVIDTNLGRLIVSNITLEGDTLPRVQDINLKYLLIKKAE